MNSKWKNIGAIDQFQLGQLTEVEVSNQHLLVVRQSTACYAFESRCPHLGQSLETSGIVDNVLECIWHGVQFNIQTGEVLSQAGFFGIPKLKTFQTKMENKCIYIEIAK